METFQELDASSEVLSLVAGDAPYQTALDIRNHVKAATFAMLSGEDLGPRYTSSELRGRCIQQMSIDLGYRRPAAN
jgi:hypothetical protein